MVEAVRPASINSTGRQFAGPVELDFDQPVVNIGGDPENDIALPGEGLQPFHAALLVDEGQYRLIPLAPEAEIRLDGERLPAAMTVVQPDQQIELGTYSLRLKPNGSPTSVHVLLAQALAPDTLHPSFPPTPVTAPRMVWTGAAGESLILSSARVQQFEIQVAQTAHIELEVVNAGPIVATFEAAVDGVSPDWVKITPPNVNLNEGQRATIYIEITPPRAPESTAGKHLLRLVVTSPNYPGQVSETPVDLAILPYYAFVLGNLTPKQQNIAWRKRTGLVTIPIANQGNSPASFEVLALDDENGCAFDIHTPEELVRTRMAVVDVPAGATYPMPIDITPAKQPMVALRNRHYHFTTTVQVAQLPNSAQSVSGAVVSQPLFGWWSIVLSALVLVLALFLLVQPNIYAYKASSDKDVIELGDSTELEWSVSPFATRLTISGVDKTINRSQNRVTVTPSQSTNYEMIASNWLSSMLNMDRRQLVTVLVVPPSPKISVFDVDNTKVMKGLPSRLRWSVTQADTVFLTVADVVYELPPGQFSGEREVLLEKDGLVTLEARSLSGSQLRSYFINVEEPRITVNRFLVRRRATSETNAQLSGTSRNAAPTPQNEFSVDYVGLRLVGDDRYVVEFYDKDESGNPRELQKGEQIMVEWDVDGVQTTQITPFADSLPSRGEQPFFPQESMNFVMTASIGDLQRLFMLPVKVFDGQPPVAPSIDFFKASPSALVGAGDVQFAWSISGEWTKITLNMGETVIAEDLMPQDFKTVKVSKTSTFILTAWNGKLSKAETLEVVVNPSLKRTTLTIDDISPHATYFRVGDTVDVTTSIVGLDQETGTPAPTGKITVTDGFSVCAIELPLKTCKLTFTSAGIKQIKASYAGDKVYLPSDSAVYTKEAIIVDANKVSLSISFFSPGAKDFQGNQVAAKPLMPNAAGVFERRLGQGLAIDVSVIPQNKPITDDSGEVTVRYCPVDGQGNRLETACITAGPAKVAKPADDTTTIGRATVVIGQFTTMGRYSLVISYRHTKDAFEPALVGNTTQDKILVEVGKGQMLLIMQTSLPAIKCTYLSCILPQGNNATVVFDAKLMMDDQGDNTPNNDLLADLFPNYPRPGNLAVSAERVSNGVNQPAWETACGWRVGSTLYQLYCQGVSLQEALNIAYRFASPDSNYEVYAKASPTRLEIRYPSFFDFRVPADPSAEPDVPFQNVFVGKKFNLQKTNIVLKERGNVIPSAEYFITLQDGNIADYVSVLSANTTCALDPAKGIKVTQTNPDNDSCLIYFKRATPDQLPITLVFRYAGSTNYSEAITTRVVTVKKQNGITAAWSPPAPLSKNAYEVFDEVITFGCTLASSCGTGSVGLGFAYEVLSEAALNINASQLGDCKLSGARLSGTRLTFPQMDEGDPAPVETLNFTCPSPGSPSLTMSFTAGSAEKFDFDRTKTDLENGSRFNFSVLAKNLPMSLTVTRNTGSTNIVSGDKISELWAGDQYWFTVSVTGVPVDVTLKPETDWIEMRLPAELVSAISVEDSSCVLANDSAGDFFKFTLTNSNQPVGVWTSTRCSILLKQGATIPAGSNLIFKLTNEGNRLVSGLTIGLPSAVSVRSGTINASVRLLTKPVSDPSPVYVSVVDTSNNKKTVTNLYVGEVYELALTLSFAPGTLFGELYFQPTITLPPELGAAVAINDHSTCLKSADPGASHRYNLTWDTTNQPNFTAKCVIQIGKTTTLPANAVIDYGLRFDLGWFGSISFTADQIFAPATVDKRPVTGLTATLLPTNSPAGADSWYVTTGPYVQIALGDEHYQYNVLDTALTAMDVKINNNTTALSCLAGSVANTIRCNLPDTAEVSSGKVTVTYNGNDTFAPSAAIEKNYKILKIPTAITLEDIELVNPGGTSTRPFPEFYRRVNKSPQPAPIYYLLTETSYTIRMTVRATVDINGSKPIPDQGTVTLTLTSRLTANTSSPGIHAQNKTVSNGTVTYDAITIASNNAMWDGRVTYKLEYSGSTLYAASSIDSANQRTVMLRRPLIVNISDWNSGKGLELAGFTTLNGTKIQDIDDRYCMDVYLEVGTLTNLQCEGGQDCWDRVTSGKEKVAVLCNGTSGKSENTGITAYEYDTGDAADGKVSTESEFKPSVASTTYQLIVLNKRYFAILKQNWE